MKATMEELKNVIFHDSQRKIFISYKIEEKEETVEAEENEKIENIDEFDLPFNDGEKTNCKTHITYKQREVGYCPFCGKMDYTVNWATPKNEKIEQENISLFTYGHHNEIFETNEQNQIIVSCSHCHKDLTGIPYKILSKTDNYYFENWRIKCYNFIKEDDKLKATIFFDIFYPNVKAGKLAIKSYNFKVIFNLKTGQSYVLEIRETYGKKQKPKWAGGSRIVNCTYSGIESVHCMAYRMLNDKKVLYDMGQALLRATNGEMVQLFNEKAIKEIESKRNVADDTWKYGQKDRIQFLDLTIYNRFPNYNKAFNENLQIWLKKEGFWDSERKKSNKKKRFLLKLSKINNEKELFDLLKKKYNIPESKKFKKLVYKNPLIAMVYNSLLKIGFEDYNVILSILEENSNIALDLSEKIGTRVSEEILVNFTKDLIKRKGEPSAKKIIFSKDYSYSYLCDSANMYNTFKRNNLLSPELLKGTIKEIHNTLSSNYRKINQRNLIIAYNKNMEKLNSYIDGFDFVLARDTHELIDVGTEMGICVGSYGRRAVENSLIIVVMKEGKKYVGCIELDAEGKTLKQAKAKFNNVLQEKKAEALKKWIEMQEIDAKNCYDYRHIAANDIEYDPDKIYVNTYNYAGFGMNW
jgi:hypothetical protein